MSDPAVLSAHDVTILRCAACGRLDPGPRDLCPACFAPLTPHVVSGAGELVSWTMIRRPPAAFRAEGAYAVALVRLDAGCQITGRLAEPDDHATPGRRVIASGHRGSGPKASGPKDSVTVFSIV